MRSRVLLILLFLLLLAASAPAAPAAPRRWLVLASVDTRGRRPFNPDAVFARYLLDPASPPPCEGEVVRGSDGQEARWVAASGDDQGVGGQISYAYAGVECESEQIVLARIPGGGGLFVNGDGFAGDIYAIGHGGVPVPLRKGINHLFVRGARGAFRLEFVDVAPGLRVMEEDATLPDVVTGSAVAAAGVPAAAVVVNASLAPRGGLLPLGVRKMGGVLTPPATPPGSAAWVSGEIGHAFTPEHRGAAEARRITFVSAIDGSVQQYSLLPPSGDARALVLSLHGAGVDALNQARSYSPKEDFWIVAPTNRRPFGFDWQDWGRLDAYEVLGDALRRTGADPRRVFLTGHSMGGHGTWHLAANDPDRFRAIAPSAGWCSFDTYGGRPGGRLDALWRGADGASLTLELVENLAQVPAYVLHGEADDNVPVGEARAMIAALPRARSHLQPGAGHWWDGDAATGADCVDWPAIFDFFREQPAAAAPGTIRFTSADPSIDSKHHSLEVLQPLRYGERLRVEVEGRSVTTTNVRRMRLPPGTYSVDGQEVEVREALFLDGTRWRSAAPPPGEKSPLRSGPFKRAFDRRFVMVYGERDGEAMRRARYDAQAWWYRANGDAAVVSDAEFAAGDFAGRNVILYGNATTNRAFAGVLPPECPIRVEQGSLRAGERRFAGSGLGCLFVHPRAGEAEALVGVVGHTGSSGARLGYNLLFFVSGVGYPDYALFGEQILAAGDEGVLMAGWFDHRWELAH